MGPTVRLCCPLARSPMPATLVEGTGGPRSMPGMANRLISCSDALVRELLARQSWLEARLAPRPRRFGLTPRPKEKQRNVPKGWKLLGIRPSSNAWQAERWKTKFGGGGGLFAEKEEGLRANRPAFPRMKNLRKAYYDVTWLQPDKQIPADAWVSCEVNLDSGMPHLGATSPRPAGHFKLNGKRALLWEPHRPLPSLHQHSCEEGRPDALYLLGTSTKGPSPRRLLPVEVQRLWGVKPERSTRSDPDEAAKHALLEPPTGLAKLAGLCAGGGAACFAPATPDDPSATDKVGVCTLPWEDEAERAMLGWVEQRQRERVVGGKGSDRRSRSHRGPEGSDPVQSDQGKGYKGKSGNQADWQWKRDLSGAVSRVLRHEGGTEASPMTEEGWMRLRVLMGHPQVARLGAQEKDLRDLVQRDNKQRYTLADHDNEAWVAAWSGHSIPFVVGPAWPLPEDAVPRLLVHGSYARHQTSISQKGIKRRRRVLRGAEETCTSKTPKTTTVDGERTSKSRC